MNALENLTSETSVALENDQPIAVLIVDNEEDHAEVVADALERIHGVCQIATSGTQGAKFLTEQTFDVIITDLMMNDLDGFGVLACAKREQPESEVILVTGHGSIPSAVSAMQQGAFNYLLKPLDLKQLRIVVQRAAESSRLRRTNVDLRRRLDERFGFEGIIGDSRPMHEVIERMKRIAPTSATVLIQGETGTGKELVAQALHQNSPRKNRPFVALNCAALSENILESELFGHIRGAFTDATSDRVGKFEYANGGTLFLDEVGDMPIATQIKLLRVLESGEITRVGANDPISVNVRLLSATNRNLEEAVAAGTFRADLYHRIKVVTIRLPPLRERVGDIPILIDYFVRMFAKKNGRKIRGVSTAARKRLVTQNWPGNVRELRNCIESMVVVDYDDLLDLDDLPEEYCDPADRLLPQHATEDEAVGHPGDAESRGEFSNGDSHSGKTETLVTDDSLNSLVGRPIAELERHFIEATLRFTAGNREEAAKLLGIGERTLYRKLREYGEN
ncbi:MAG: sigma-54 dependent transcriptional regulator [Thermoguttaceae bacterium]|nr:sigma-54 dependent transcriptional regulator [Thermoguttaceae bacterium]